MPDLLVERARSGDARAFEALYREHLGRVYALCLRMTADPAAAEEATQRTFVTAWQRLGGFRGEGAFSTWLHRIAVNAVLQGRRSALRHPVQAAPDEIRAATPPHPGVRMDLERAIATLPEGARQVFVLHDVEGWPHDDVAAALGVTAGTSKSQLHRARGLLREALRR